MTLSVTQSDKTSNTIRSFDANTDEYLGCFDSLQPVGHQDDIEPVKNTWQQCPHIS